MIYLNSNSTVSNPDIGFAFNYNDGVYRHGGFFRDASDNGTFKVFENYSPEPDANIFIDTAHATFKLANIAATTFFGNVSGTAGSLSNFTTANLAEGTNLYFTNTRARAVYTAGKGINIDTQGVIKNTGRTALYNTDINGTGGGNVLSTMSTILTLPTVPSTDRFLLRSLLVTNLSDSTSYVSGNILYATGNTAVFANQIPIATGGLVEFIKNGQLLQPGDTINLQGFNSASTAT